jgi:hypothetical protein
MISGFFSALSIADPVERRRVETSCRRSQRLT